MEEITEPEEIKKFEHLVWLLALPPVVVQEHPHNIETLDIVPLLKIVTIKGEIL